ncbi:hypothetical protein EHQ53_06030 [Leptospira langatensis]|uniref:Uncharacterized protein n=1 Tax=Leptospira langatensis TaxID=2484983 RepID=A0A5F1ZTJ7_9LEPT|nr:hypothetical protein [Leptospira langatensis]TGK03017.1 hypothetical protein EHO57_06865 [Leptospira langatensis]TGL41773.1 hypothetical protein EHQ53_06030 [Leptospira langatensis]
MVQVDVFWAYGLGAGYAMAAARQIKKLQSGEKTKGSLPSVTKEEGKNPFWKNIYFITNLLYLSLLFAPSGLYLVWQFTSWETMHAGDKGMPGWLVALFGLTNVSQGILGFWVVWALLKAGKNFLAYLQIPLGYFGMFFILVHGWDGTGYKRFFSESLDQFQNGWTWNTAANWLLSDVAITLYVMGVILVPVLIYTLLKIEKEGWELGGSGEFTVRNSPSAFSSTIAFLATVFVGALGLAILCSAILHQLGWILGTLFSVAGIYLLGISKFGIFPLLYRAVLQTKEEGKLQTAHSAA